MNNKYDVIITSPENAVSANHLKPFLTRQESTHSLHIIVDEAHCIRKWGQSNFRKAWYEIGLIVAFVRTGVPFAAVSATLSSETQQTVIKSLHFDPRDFVLVNIGNFRSNIFLTTKHLSGTGSKALLGINSLLPPLTGHSLPLTLIFVNSRTDGHALLWHLQKTLPPSYVSQIRLFHALLAERTKKMDPA